MAILRHQPEVIQGGGPWYKLDRPMVHGGTPLYRASDSTLHWSDSRNDPARIHVLPLDPETGDVNGPLKTLFIEEGVPVQCLRRDNPGSYVCAYSQGVGLLNEDSGELQLIEELIPDEERQLLKITDGAVDCEGRMWLIEADLTATKYGPGRIPVAHGRAKGRLWRYDPDGTCTMMDNGLVCGAGIAWSPNCETMYLTDSVARMVFAYDFDPDSGLVGDKRLFIDRRKAGGEPHGIVVDIDGNLWIAMWGTGSVMVYDPEGRHIKTVQFSAKDISYLAWGGPDNDDLYIMSGVDCSPTRSDDDEGGHLFRYRTGVAGLFVDEFEG